MSPKIIFAINIVLLVQVTSNQAAYTFNKNPEYTPRPKDQCACMLGPSGPAGVPGVNGLHGERGLDGRPGIRGEQGFKGDQGWKGESGINGLEGPPGKRGRKGAHGDTGTEGLAGNKGHKGDRGYLGMMGEKGQKGERPGPARKIAFSVARSLRLGPVLLDTPITFDVVFTNMGEAFDSFSSHFICKVNGTYIFMTHILGQNNKDVYAWIMLNDKHKVPLHGDGRAGYGTGSQTIILNLKADDHVWIQLSKDSGLLNDYTTFSGYIVFDD